MTHTAIATLRPMQATAEDKWREGGLKPAIRIDMLRKIGYAESFANVSWSKLPYLIKTNLSAQNWN